MAVNFRYILSQGILWFNEHRLEVLLVSVVVLLAAVLRFYGLDYQGLWNDELASWTMSNKSTLSSVLDAAQHDNHPPGYHILLYYVIKYIGDSESSLRMLSAASGILSVFWLFLLGKHLYSYKVGLLSSAIMSVLWCPIFYSQMARSYSLLLLFGLMATYFWVRILEQPADKRFRNVRLPAVCYVLSAVACSYLHYYGTYFIALQGVAMVVFTARKLTHLGFIILLYSFVLLAYLPWVPEMVNDLGRSYTFFSRPNSLYPIYYLQFFMNKSLALLLLSFGICLLSLVGLIRRYIKEPELVRSERVGFMIDVGVLAWLIVPFALVYIYSLLSPSSVLRFYAFIFCLPAACLLLARAVFLLPISINAQIIGACVFVVLLLGHLVVSMRFYSEPHIENYWNHPRWGQFRETARYVAGNYSDYQPAAIVACPNITFFNYYLRRYDVPVYNSVSTCSGSQTDKIEKILETQRPQYVWLLFADGRPDKHLEQYCLERFTLVKDKVFECAAARLYLCK